MMAVTVDQDLFVELRGLVVGCEFDEEFAEEISLVAELAGSRIVRKEVGELVAEDAGAGGFEYNDGDVVFQLWGQGVEDFEQIVFSGVEHAEVVEGAAAAEMLRGQRDAEAGGGEDLVGGAHGGRVEVVVEGVGTRERLRRLRAREGRGGRGSDGRCGRGGGRA